MPRTFAFERPRVIGTRIKIRASLRCGLHLGREHDRQKARRDIGVRRIGGSAGHISVVVVDSPGAFVPVEFERTAIVVIVGVHVRPEVVVVTDDIEGAAEKFRSERVDAGGDVDGCAGCAEVVVDAAESVHGRPLIRVE